MNELRSIKLSNYTNILDVCNRHSNAWWDAVPAFRRTYDAIKTKVDRINTLNTELIGTPKFTTEAKKRVKVEMIHKTMLVTGAARAYAASVGNLELVSEMSFSPSSISQIKEKDADDLCLSKIKKAQAILQHLSEYGISQIEMDIAIASITSYTGMIGKAKSYITAKKGQNVEMDNLFSDVDKRLKNELDPLMIRFAISNPSFYAEYFGARKLARKKAKKTDETTKGMGK